jgi:uncharacterized small protein (DUF1192 family)
MQDCHADEIETVYREAPMADDSLPLKKNTVHEVGQDISPLPIGEIARRIGQLQAEISRLEAALRAKQATQAAAEALFRRPEC